MNDLLIDYLDLFLKANHRALDTTTIQVPASFLREVAKRMKTDRETIERLREAMEYRCARKLDDNHLAHDRDMGMAGPDLGGNG